jgi:D-serine deaminase-like pyridoxal phosphate-dependent protein
MQPAPAGVGMGMDDVDTPALIVDLDVFEANLDRMAALVGATGPAGVGVALRPHAKTHKSPWVALQQEARGAVGVCVQKVAEAEAMVAGGIGDVLVSNEVVGRSKLDRLAVLARRARIGVCVDDATQIDALDAAAGRAGVTLRVLVEVDVGAGRCGVLPGAPAATLAGAVAEAEHLAFGGLQGYQGAAQHLRTALERRAAVSAAAGSLASTVERIALGGLDCAVVTGGGTGTVDLDAATGVYTEIQAGSYAFMDADYARNLDDDGRPVSGFGQSLFVLAVVMSASRPGTAVVDAGHKAVAVDSGLPLVHDRPGVVYVAASDEHGTLAVDVSDAAAVPPRLGEKLLLVPGHCDPTVDRFDWYVGVRAGTVESLWPVAARGAMH